MTSKRIAHYKALGWTFEHREEVDNHNGDIDDYHYVKSPRLDEEVSVGPFDKVTEAHMLKREKEAYVKQRLGYGWEHESNGNTDAVEEAVTAALLKDPEAKRITVTIRLS